jgi:cytidylate kinase
MVIAIDGPAGAGKSTVARRVAAALGFTYLDTGAMYRAAALSALNGRPPRDADIVLADGTVRLDGEDVTGAIRTPEVTEAASRLAADPQARAALTEKQRAILSAGDWVAEGRDVGTVVKPDAEVKVFLTADPAERARRRAAELGADVAEVLEQQARRDARDTERAAAPLTPADDAVHLDTTRLDVDAVVARIVELAR